MKCVSYENHIAVTTFRLMSWFCCC